MQNPHSAKIGTITGVLLAGGKSRRMGCDKAHIEVAGQPLFARSLELLRHYFARVIIAGDRSDLAQEDILSIPDLYPGSALGGLYTGLRAAETDWVFIAPCDMPYPDPRIIELLLDLRSGADAVVPRTPGGYEPVFALYHKNCLQIVEEALQQGKKCIYDTYQRINVHYLDWQQMPNDWELRLLNINTPVQLEQLRRDRQ